MARVVDSEEPVVTHEREVIHDDRPRSNAGLILLVLLILIILIALFAWRPWGGSSSTNVNIPSPSNSSRP